MIHRPWWPARLVERLLRGPGSEYLRGDLHESWRTLLGGPGPRWRAEWRHLLDTVASVMRWWAPGNVRERARGARDVDDFRERWKMGGGVGELVHALRTAGRSLRRHPGFAVVTILTLGLGIGATTTILSVVDGVMLRPLPYEDESSLVAVGVTFPGREWVEGVEDLQHLAGVSLANFRDLRERTRTLDRLAGIQIASALLPDRGEGPEMLRMARVTDDFFAVLGAGVSVGRLFTPDEYGPAEVRPVVISHGTWQTRFGGDASVVGRSLPAPEGVAAPVVVGVLSADFVPPENVGAAEVEFWQPLDPTHPRYEGRGTRSLSLLGRLAPEGSVEAARAELDELAAELARAYPEGNVHPDGSWFGYGVNGLREDLVGTARPPLVVFLGAAALLLLIAAMNTANILLVRTTDRIGELSVRRALGAGRGTVVTHVLAESTLLALAAGVLGLGLAMLGVKGFLAMTPEIPRMDRIGVDARVLAVATALSLGAGLLVGLIPAIRVARRDPAVALRSSGPRAGGGSGGSLRNALVTAQLALALLLGVGASVLMHSFVKVTSVDPGFVPEGLVTFRLAAKRPGGSEIPWVAWDETLAAVRDVPGLSDVAGVSNLPFEDPNWAPGMRFPGETEAELRTGIAGYAVTPGYFEAMGQSLIAGRGVLPSDAAEAQPVAVVNQALVDRDFGGVDAIGTTVLLGEDAVEYRIVGIAENVVVRRVEEGPQPALYVPYTQIEWPWVKVVVRSKRSFGPLADDLRRAAAVVSPIVPIQDLGRIEDRIRRVETEPRFQAWLIGAFALAALLLATVGLYASLAYAVGRREQEMGVRLALGADPRRVFAMVLRQGAAVAGIGAVMGVTAAAALAGLLERFLFGVPALDPLALVVALSALGVATAAAVLPPALRATRVDVVRSLRSE